MTCDYDKMIDSCRGVLSAKYVKNSDHLCLFERINLLAKWKKSKTPTTATSNKR